MSQQKTITVILDLNSRHRADYKGCVDLREFLAENSKIKSVPDNVVVHKPPTMLDPHDIDQLKAYAGMLDYLESTAPKLKTALYLFLDGVSAYEFTHTDALKAAFERSYVGCFARFDDIIDETVIKRLGSMPTLARLLTIKWSLADIKLSTALNSELAIRKALSSTHYIYDMRDTGDGVIIFKRNTTTKKTRRQP